MTYLVAPLGDDGWAADPDSNTIWINQDIPEPRRHVYKQRALAALVQESDDGTRTLRVVDDPAP